MANANIVVLLESVICQAMNETAVNVLQKYGLKLDEARFIWNDKASPPVLTGVEIKIYAQTNNTET